jgi:hypothetical protein
MNPTGQALHICVIGSKVEAVAFRDRVASERPIHLHVFSSILEFQENKNTQTYYSGIVIDSRLAVKMSQAEKNYIREAFEGRTPLFEAVLTTTERDLINEKIFQTKWNNFLRQAEVFDPRGRRIKPRKFCVLKVELCFENSWDNKKTTKAITADLSIGGCFVVTPDFTKSTKKLWIKIDDIPDPIECRVAWHREWEDTRNKWPGVGVEFVKISPKARDQITQLFGALE